MSDKPLFLRINKGDQVVGIKQVQGSQVVIGSSDDANAKLDGPNISPIHAMIDKRDDGFYISDLGSESGVFLNGQKVVDTRIESGEEFQVGEYVIEFYEGIPKPKSKPGAAVVAPPPPVPNPPGSEERGEAPPVEVKPETPESSTTKEERHDNTVPAAPPMPVEARAEVEKAESIVSTSSSSDIGFETYREKRTFAPPNPFGDLNERLKPEKGTTVEVVLAWNDTVLDTTHYNEQKTLTVGSHPKNDIILPVFGSSAASHPLIEIKNSAEIFFTSDMMGALINGNKRVPFDELIAKGKAKKSGVGYVVELEQGTMIRIDFSSGVSIFVRYVSQPAKPLIGPFFDLTTKELTNLVLTLGFTILMALIFLVMDPDPIEEVEEEVDDSKRRAVFVYQPPPTPIEPVPVKEKKVVKVTKKAKAKPQRTRSKTAGKASDAPKNNSTSQKKVPTTANRGKDKGIKLGGRTQKGKGSSRSGAPQKDVGKSGLLGAFGKNGAQNSLRSAIDGAGSVSGAAEVATGSGSQRAAGSGVVPGGGLNQLGKGGQGESTYGISGVQTKGRGGGVSGYGTGAIGTKASTTIVPGGEEEAFAGGIDREAVRRVVLRNLNQLKACYERVTRVDPTVGGKVVLNWTIVARGRVGQAKVANSDIKNKVMLNCMLSRLKTWRFPEPPEGLVGDVTYPFVFAATSN